MTTWVLLRGLMREARHWGEFAATFQAQLSGTRVVARDLPGNGRLHHLRSPLHLEEPESLSSTSLRA